MVVSSLTLSACEPIDAKPAVPDASPLSSGYSTGSSDGANASKRRRAEDFAFDGFQLGDKFSRAVKIRTPYAIPCSVDVLGKSKRRMVVYGAKKCGGREFPEKTSAAFLLAHIKGADEFAQPIQAFAWFGGSWFSTRSDFPLQVGDPDTSASSVLGAPVAIFELFRPNSPRALIVRGHPHDTWSLSNGTTLVGFVAGPMPGSPKDEQWQALLRVYEAHGVAR